MSETAKIRLVRCPKCENLLPEVTDYSVYQCGGCGAVLRAKNKGVRTDGVSDKPNEGRIAGTAQKLTDGYDDKMANVSERRATMDMSDGSESDVRSSISSSSRAERRVLRDADHSDNKENFASKIATLDGDGRHQAKIGEGLDDQVTDGAKEGPSNPLSKPTYSNENQATDNRDEAGEYSNVDPDRAELLKKLDELKDQLSRSGNLINKGKEKVAHEWRMARQDPYWHPESSLDMNPVLVQNPYPDPQFVSPPYQNHQYTEPPGPIHRQEIGGRGFYAPNHHAPGYGDPMHRRGLYGASAPYQMFPTHPYRLGPYSDDSMVYMDPIEPYPPNFSRHHLSCSCYHCRQKRQLPNDRIFSYHDNPSSFASRDYNHRLPDAHPVRPRNTQPLHTRWPSDLDSEVDGFMLRRPPRVHLVSGGKRCHPMARGAPFLTCYNCFELLFLPKRVFAKEDDRKKIRCGACSTLIVFTVVDGNLVISYDMEAKEEVEDVLPMNGSKHPNQVRTTFSSEDYDNYGYDFNSTGRESETRQGRANRSTESNNRHSTSTHASEAEEDWESLGKNKARSPPLGSSLQDHFEHSNKYHVTNRSKDGNRSGRSDHEKQLPNKVTSRQISGKESSATEIDLSSNEFGNTGTTFDSGEGSREGDQLKVSRGAESFFAGIIKKSFKDKSNDGSDQEKASVTVNGHLIPSRAIKKAEKVAGAINPGHYWYDFRAGFWGVMGGPCLGIIPPFIEEFNYPMPQNCAGGNTGVFVNGRELNQKDLKLLGSRGLPMERDRSYIIEISGRVLDEDTGQELDSLGKLAPTVERMKRGFGMKAPKAAA